MRRCAEVGRGSKRSRGKAPAWCERRYAVASALAASAVPALVMARGHRIDAVPELPLVVEDGAQNLTKTAKAVELLKRLGCQADIDRAKASRNLRRGKGKMRNRRYVTRKGPLVVYSESMGIDKAFRNLPGVDVQCVERLNLLQVSLHAWLLHRLHSLPAGRGTGLPVPCYTTWHRRSSRCWCSPASPEQAVLSCAAGAWRPPGAVHRLDQVGVRAAERDLWCAACRSACASLRRISSACGRALKYVRALLGCARGSLSRGWAGCLWCQMCVGWSRCLHRKGDVQSVHRKRAEASGPARARQARPRRRASRRAATSCRARPWPTRT